ncbi:calcium-activated chloride channel regulator 1-like [Anopheles ziemanni]|uniref:calcium-activated chloride channel regulator 1-like n=1 Tax=Anopheles coustani TaxID=139045 RepID=UPI00265A42B1|nr:calcium-activated chloride channel regulator 1-like [Anopheles coustani]XP_058173700.1 calcium-activated chloride channel regulator 1-like [Anopheles ziemanni]
MVRTLAFPLPLLLVAAMLGLGVPLANGASSITVEKSAYKNVVIEIRDNVPVDNCQTILQNLEIMLTSASQYLFNALDSRVYFGEVSVILPNHWPQSCIPYNQTRTSASGETADVTIRPQTKAEPSIWTQQYAGCGEAGEQIYIDPDILGRETIWREFIREWAKYRYGVFDEIGYDRDPVYPRCYINDEHKVKLTGCSDAPVNDEGLCGSPSSPVPVPYNISRILDPNARTSIMFAAESKSVTMFCDEGTHNRYAPTKHNQLCDRRSTYDVILKHSDFAPQNQMEFNPSVIINTVPKFSYKSRKLTRYVIVIGQTFVMRERETWSFLRRAIRKWIVYDLPATKTEIGIALANDTATYDMLPITSLQIEKNKDRIASFIPYTSSDLNRPTCLSCGISDAIHMLNEQTRHHGPASSVILVIAPGMDIEHESLARSARASKIRIATINYPIVEPRRPLDALAHETGGSAYSVFECRDNSEKSLVSTYFEMSSALYNIGKQYYEGNRNEFPVEIFRRVLVDSVGETNSQRSSRTVTGNFMLDPFMGPPAEFFIYVHNSENPLVSNVRLTNPNGIVYASMSDARASVRQLSLLATINETGIWNYSIERFQGNPQPHYVQVIATPRSKYAPVITARAWVHRGKAGGPMVVFAEVKKGDLPVVSAQVEVAVTKLERICERFREPAAAAQGSERFVLLDTGAGDPDITKGDGVYSRYFNADEFGGPGTYQLEVTVSDRGNTAYTLADGASYTTSSSVQPGRCCGSSVPIPQKQSLDSFERILPPMTVFVSQADLVNAAKVPVGRISDLSADVEGMKVRLSWTSPDMGGKNVARYEVKYATTIKDIVDNFDTAAVLWHHDTPFTFSIGEGSEFTMNITHEPHLFGQILYFAVRPYATLTKDAEPGPISNYVRAFVTKPKPTTLYPPSSTGGTESYDSIWSSYDGIAKNGDDSMDIIPRIAKTMDLGPELILPIIAGIILLLALILIYCWFCVVKKRHDTHDDEQKKPIKSFKSDTKLTSSHSVIVTAATNGGAGNGSSPSSNSTTSSSSSPNHHGHQPGQTTLPQSNSYDLGHLGDHQTVGIPTIYNIDDDVLLAKKRYSAVINMGPPTHPMEQQLIEELKQQQHIIDTQSFILPNHHGSGGIPGVVNGNGNSQNNNNCSVSIISTTSNNTTLTRTYNPNAAPGTIMVGGRTLSPYESWSASQLLQEHEQHQQQHQHAPRRHSPPLIDDLIDNNVVQQPSFYGQQQQQPLIGGGQPLHPQHMLGQSGQPDQMSLLNNNHLNENGSPPVPPLPIYTTSPSGGVPVGNTTSYVYGQSHHGSSVSSVNSGLGGSLQNGGATIGNTDTKKRRNVTMV